MKLRISDKQWRVRVNKHELDTLLINKPIVMVCKLPDDTTTTFNVSLNNNLDAHIEKHCDTYFITFPKSKLRSISDVLPDKKGVSFDLPTENGALQLVFQVDVRSEK